MKEVHPFSQSTLFITTSFFSLYVKKYSLWEFKITKTLFIVPFSLWKAQFKVLCVCSLGRLVLFVLFSALHVGFFPIQCGCLARELHTLQIQPEELHGDQLCGVRPCGESCLRNTLTSSAFWYTCFIILFSHLMSCLQMSHIVLFVFSL